MQSSWVGVGPRAGHRVGQGTVPPPPSALGCDVSVLRKQGELSHSAEEPAQLSLMLSVDRAVRGSGEAGCATRARWR